jgi:hypothetical protein
MKTKGQQADLPPELPRRVSATRRKAVFMARPFPGSVRDAEEMRTRAGYMAQPDSEAGFDDWSTAEEWDS